MKHNLTYFLVMLLACLSAQAAQVNTEKTISVNGTTRSYILYVPDNLASSPALVFSLHGASGHSTDRSPFSTSVADSKGCIVVYPQGANQYFAVFGGTTTGWNASGESNEDLDFFKAIISEVTTAYPQIDKNRIYCTGFSNGGMMVYSNSNTASDIFAAFASISGYPINEMHLHHSGARPVPFLHIHGKADDFVKYSLMGTIRDNMVARNGCNPVPTVTKGTNYTKSVYAAGYNSFPYVYYEIDGMGHNDYTSYTEDGNSALTMWNFISNYKLTDTCDRTLKWNPNLDLNGFEPSEHGWTVTDGTKFVYGDATTTQNVSHSLQFEKGDYQLRILTTGTSTNKVKVKLASTSGTQVFYKYVNIGTKAYIPFSIPEYGEYTITIIKDASTDKFSILGIYMTSSAWSGAEEITGNDVATTTKTVTEEVPFTQTDSETTLCTMSTSNGVTTFTTKNGGDVEVVYKMLNVDVTGYSKVIVNFAEATSTDFLAAFGSDQPTIPSGTTQYTYSIPTGTTTLSEIALISLWKSAGTTVKVKSVQLYKEEEVIADEKTDLQASDFKSWTSADASATAKSTTGCTYSLNTSTQLPYGDVNVYYLNYADLTSADYLYVTASEGEPRLCFNRLVDNGTVTVELPRDKDKYETVTTNDDGSKTYIINIAAIVADAGFAHLNCIKGANWQNTTVTNIQYNQTAIIPGDLDNDSKVTLTDMVKDINLLNKNITNVRRADVNGDNTVNKDDISSLSTILLSK